MDDYHHPWVLKVARNSGISEVLVISMFHLGRLKSTNAIISKGNAESVLLINLLMC